VGDQYKDVDWDGLYKALSVHARALRLFWKVNDTFDSGLSESDLVGETLTAFLESKNRLGWKPGKGASLPTYLCRVLHNKFVDHLRRTRKIRGSLDDEVFAKKTLKESDYPAPSAEYKSLEEEMLVVVGHDQELRDLITAVGLTDGGHNVNQQLAELMGKSPREVVNLKRRLLNVKGIKELHGQRPEERRRKG
jgi:DNA-directed RNA polymerase specialized sigma24 family protein